MNPLMDFYRKYSSQNFSIRTQNNVQIFKNVNISQFFIDRAAQVIDQKMSWVRFYGVVVQQFNGVDNGRRYTYNDWSRNSQVQFREICQEFYNALTQNQKQNY